MKKLRFACLLTVPGDAPSPPALTEAIASPMIPTKNTPESSAARHKAYNKQTDWFFFKPQSVCILLHLPFEVIDEY